MPPDDPELLELLELDPYVQTPPIHVPPPAQYPGALGLVVWQVPLLPLLDEDELDDELDDEIDDETDALRNWDLVAASIIPQGHSGHFELAGHFWVSG
jgi:hypothetical protein